MFSQQHAYANRVSDYSLIADNAFTRVVCTVSGKVYIIKPEDTSIQVQCEMETDGWGWTVGG